MCEYIDDVFDGLKSMGTFSEDLAVLAEAFEITGNEKMASEMTSIASGLRSAEDRIRDAVAKEVNRRAGNT